MRIGAPTLVLLLCLVSCDTFRPLREGNEAVDVELIREAGLREDPSLTAPLLEILERWIASDREAGRQLYFQVLAASLAVGDRGDREAIPLLASLTEDPDASIRAHAAEALVLLGGADTHVILARLREEEPDPLVRLRAD